MGVETETEDSETANVIVRFIENIAIFVSCIVLISWTILGLNHENGIKSTEIVALIFLSVLLLGSIFSVITTSILIYHTKTSNFATIKPWIKLLMYLDFVTLIIGIICVVLTQVFDCFDWNCLKSEKITLIIWILKLSFCIAHYCGQRFD